MIREKLSCYLKIISNVTTIIIHICYYSNLKIIYSILDHGYPLTTLPRIRPKYIPYTF